MPERWEHGSDLFDVPDVGTPVFPWRQALFAGSGRQALAALVEWAMARQGWKRLWLPDFFCPDVHPSLRATGVALITYPDDPRTPLQLEGCAFAPGDAVLVSNTWGVRARPDLELPPFVSLVEDHTHDLASEWARQSRADWALASLRKSLPLPDGGVLWSPRGHALPAEPARSDAHESLAARRLAAMRRKAAWLAGGAGNKDEFRTELLATESGLADERPVAISAHARARLQTLPTERWRSARSANFEVLTARLAGIPGATVVSRVPPGVPFAATLVFTAPGKRERVRQALVGRAVYGAVLWPIGEGSLGATRGARRLAATALSLHCDFRYSAEDMERVARQVLETAWD